MSLKKLRMKKLSKVNPLNIPPSPPPIRRQNAEIREIDKPRSKL